MNKFIPLICSVILMSCSPSKPDYKLIATYQDLSIPKLQVPIDENTKVLVVVPHADDETIAGGLIAHFNKGGATTHLLMLCGHNDIRTEELNCSTENLGIEKWESPGFVNNPWENIVENKIEFWYDQKDSIKSVISRKIHSFQPDYIITYDSEIGGYGHPEHLIAARLTEDIFNENIANPDFNTKSIFQITLSKDLVNFSVARAPGYEEAKKFHNSNGLPSPDVALDIRPYWKTKNKAGLCHQSQIKILRRFNIVYDEKYEDQHINAFSHEYYKVVAR